MAGRSTSVRIVVVATTALVGAAVCAGGLAGSADARTHVLRPSHDARNGFVKYRVGRFPAKKIVRAVLVRGQWRRVLRLGRIRRSSRGGRLVVRAARWGVRQRLRVVVDKRRPRTTLTAAPGGIEPTGDATFRFRSNERSRFQCRLDGAAWRRCASPMRYRGLADGLHRFVVRARDRVDNRDRTPARRRWRVQSSQDEAGRPVDGAPSNTEGDPERPEDPETVPVDPVAADVLMQEAFSGSDGVITNHYAYWSDDPDAFRSDTWEMESGCSFRSGNTMWTGVPTSNLPNRNCSNGSGSEVFRFWTKREDFGNADVRFLLRNNGYTNGSDVNPERSWDGIKIYLRRLDGLNFYTAEVNRRQGNVIIQKKCPQDGGTYFLLEQVRLEVTPAQIGVWEEVGGTAVNLPGGGVRVQVVRQGQPVLEAIDNGTGCPPLVAPGRVGIRGDNTDFSVDDFEVRSVPP
jgi:hypothetical protein